MLIDKDELEQLNAKLHSSEVIYEWVSVAYGEKSRNISRFGAISGGIVPLWPFIFFADIQFNSKEFWGLSALVWLAWLRPDIFMPDHRYCYNLTQAGIHYTDRKRSRMRPTLCTWFCLGWDCGLFASFSRRWPVSVYWCRRFCTAGLWFN